MEAAARGGDFAVVMVGARLPDPELGQTDAQFMPLIAGAKWQGQWAQANRIIYPVASGDLITVDEINTSSSLESYINRYIGKLTNISAYIRFRNEGDWNGIHQKDDYGIYKDTSLVIKSLMDAMKDGYIQRFPKDPTLLGEAERTPSGRGGGEWPTLEKVYNLLDPENDYGLFVDSLGMP